MARTKSPSKTRTKSNIELAREGRAHNREHQINDYRQYMFPFEYTKDFNATEAAIRCGYSEVSAAPIGCGLVKKFEKKIQAIVSERMYKINITAESVLQELAKIAFINPNDFYDDDGKMIPIHQLPRHLCAAISSFEVEIKDILGKDSPPMRLENVKYRLWDKKSATETLMKYLGLLIEHKQITGKDGKPLIPQHVTQETTHKFDPSNLSDKQLQALVTLAGDDDVMKEIEESPDEE